MNILFGLRQSVFVLLIGILSLGAFAEHDEAFYQSLARFDEETYEFQGLTDAGIEELKKLRDAFRERNQLFGNNFRALDDIHHTSTVARLSESHMFLYGPPGGGKSAALQWMIDGEDGDSFQLQLNQMMTEQAFIGGQNFDAAKAGRFELNTEGSLADYRVAIIDEMEKGNPAALASLLSLLNERVVRAGGQQIEAKTETVFATSNANLPEIFQQFVENGQGSTAPALLNRFHFKGFVYNWLAPVDHRFLANLAQNKRKLKALAMAHPEVLKQKEFRNPPKIDWEVARFFAMMLIGFDRYFDTMYNEFSETMRTGTLKAVRESEQRHLENRHAEPFVYFPSFDPSTRLSLTIPYIVIMSAFSDFLLSAEANDGNIELSTSKVQALSPLSLWRCFLVMTTVGPGQTDLKLNEDGKSVEINFGLEIDEAKARDQRERLLIENLKNEQQRFGSAYSEAMEKYQEALSKSSKRRCSGDKESCSALGADENDFEMRVMNREGL